MMTQVVTVGADFRNGRTCAGCLRGDKCLQGEASRCAGARWPWAVTQPTTGCYAKLRPIRPRRRLCPLARSSRVSSDRAVKFSSNLSQTKFIDIVMNLGGIRNTAYYEYSE